MMSGPAVCWLKLMPRNDSVCARCRVGVPGESDTWCNLCRATERLVSLAKRPKVTAAYRAFAEELVVQTTRQVEAVFELDSRSKGYIESLSQRLSARSSTPAEAPKSAEIGATPKAATKPPLPRSPPSGVKQEESASAARVSEGGASGSAVTGAGEEEPAEVEDKKRDLTPLRRAPTSGSHQANRSRSRHRGRRGGQKHQQKFRALDNPSLRFHRKWQPEKICLKEGSQKDRRHPWRKDGGPPRGSR